MADSTKTTGTMIASCSCKNAYQDARYGPNLRVFNLGPKASPNKTAGRSCTVCGARAGI